jgi:hypothetical protein
MNIKPTTLKRPPLLICWFAPGKQANLVKTKVFITPHGPLHAVPFESLLSHENAAVQVIPDGSVLVGQNKVEPTSGPDLFFIDPDFNASSKTIAQVLQRLNIPSPIHPDGKRGQGMWGFQIPPIPESDDQFINEKTNASNAIVYRNETALEDILRSQKNPPQTLVIQTRCLGESSGSTNGNPAPRLRPGHGWSQPHPRRSRSHPQPKYPHGRRNSTHQPDRNQRYFYFRLFCRPFRQHHPHSSPSLLPSRRPNSPVPVFCIPNKLGPQGSEGSISES